MLEVTSNAYNSKISNTTLYSAGKPSKASIVVHSRTNILLRLWFIITNPFFYIFAGKIRW